MTKHTKPPADEGVESLAACERLASRLAALTAWAVVLGYIAGGALTYGHVWKADTDYLSHIGPGEIFAAMFWPLYWLGQLGIALTP